MTTAEEVARNFGNWRNPKPSAFGIELGLNTGYRNDLNDLA